LIYGAAIAAFAFFCALARTKETNRSIWVALTAFVPTVFIVWISEYFVNVSHTGYVNGYGYVVTAYAVSLGLAALALKLFAGDEESSGAGLLTVLSGLLFLFLLVGYSATWLYNRNGTDNNRQWGALGNITTAPKTEKPVLPDTDPNEMVVMDVHLAYTRAHQSLGNGGANLGSYFDVIENEGVQQWIAGRNWFVFPLELNSWTEQVGWFTQHISCGHGYVAVPADSPDADVKVESGLCLQYLPDSSFSFNLQRYVYSHGYNDGELVDPTMELDDNWHPYFTITYDQPAFVVGGHQVVKVLIVDPANGEIKEYAPNAVPVWVDRVTSEDMVKAWTDNFAKYHENPQYWNSNGAGQSKVDTIRLVNTHGQQQVWQVPLLANKNGASSTNGIVLYDTRAAKGTLYESEGASGLASSGALEAAFENISQNTRQWKVEHIQWYSIQGVPTWMAIYKKEVQVGTETRTVFAGIGFLDARDTNSADVQFGLSKEEALNAYKDWLSHPHSGQQVAEQVLPKKLSGVVLRIGHDVLTNNQSTYTIVLKGDARIFNVSHNLNPLLSVAHEGDEVSIGFDEPAKPSGNVRQATAFSDATLDGQMKGAGKN
jgi:hypothetical protein